MPHSRDWNWRIGVNEPVLAGTKASMVARGIPAPTQAVFRDFTTRTSRGPGGVVRHGHANVEMLWTRMDHYPYYVLRDIIDRVGDGRVYMTVYRTDGYTPGGSWINISGYPSLEDGGPEQPQSGVFSYRTSASILNILLKVNNIAILDEDVY
jgi:hypothetical protein